MSDQTLTPHEFLRLNKSQIENLFDESFPSSEGEPSFVPGLYSAANNPMLAEMKQWKLDNVAKASERKTILNWVVPILLVGPGLISIILGGFTMVTALLFTIGTMVIVGFLGFYGRIWGWESKRYADNVEMAQRGLERLQSRRAKQWATARYDMRTDQIEWSEFSNFYIEGIAYCWKEQEPGKYVIMEVETQQEPPLLEQ